MLKFVNLLLRDFKHLIHIICHFRRGLSANKHMPMELYHYSISPQITEKKLSLSLPWQLTIVRLMHVRSSTRAMRIRNMDKSTLGHSVLKELNRKSVCQNITVKHVWITSKAEQRTQKLIYWPERKQHLTCCYVIINLSYLTLENQTMQIKQQIWEFSLHLM